MANNNIIKEGMSQVSVLIAKEIKRLENDIKGLNKQIIAETDLGKREKFQRSVHNKIENINILKYGEE